jgi:hypothetical protein
MNGTAVYGETVVVIEVGGGDVRLKTGRIESNGSSHVLADNCKRTVVRSDREFQPADPLEDARVREYEVDNIHLLKVQEAEALRDPASADDWFGSIYQDWLVNKIQRALKRLKL